MSLLKGLKPEGVKVEKPKDILGGGGTRPSGVSLFTIKSAYFLKADSGALGFHLKAVDEDGSEYRESLYVTSGDAKGNKSTYTDRNGNEQFLPGFNVVNAICLMTVGTELGEDLELEDATLKHYSKDAGSEVATEVDLVPDMIGEKVYLAIKHTIKNKQVDVAGKWVDTVDKRESNEIAAVFHAETEQTVNEAEAEQEAEFKGKWEAKYTGKPFDSYREPKGSPAKGNSVTSSGGGTEKKKSMFKK